MGRKVSSAGKAGSAGVVVSREARTPEQVERDRAQMERVRGSAVRWSRDDTQQHMAFVEQLLLERPDLTDRQRLAACRNGGYAIGAGRLRALTARIREAWEADDSALRAKRKSEQGRRLLRHMGQARGEKYLEGPQKGQWKSKPNWPAVAKFEELYAALYGTRDPIKVSVDVRMSEALTLSIAQMTPEELMEEVQAYNREVELAEAYRREHPEVTVLESAAE